MKTILLTGLSKTNLKAQKLIDESAAKALQFALQEVQPIADDKIIFQKKNYDWLILTSPTASDIFFEKNKSARIEFENIAAVGPSTLKAIEKSGFNVSLVPKKNFSAQSLVQLFPQAHTESALYPCSKLADHTLEEALKVKGYRVDRVNTYCPIALPTKTLPHFTDVIFFSSSGVDLFHKNYGSQSLENKNAVAIGQSTATAFKSHFKYDPITPAESTVSGAVKALL